MKQFDDDELRQLLASYDVQRPSPTLITETKQRMHIEMRRLATAPATGANWVILLVGLSVAMCLCLFYMFTVGTMLRFVLPTYMMTVLRHSMYAFTAASGSLVAFGFMVLYFKQFHVRRTNPVEYQG